MDEPLATGRHRTDPKGGRAPMGSRHRIAAAFADEADAQAALADLQPLAHEVHVDVHLAGCHEVDEAERTLGRTMLRCILIATPLTMVALALLGFVFNDAFGDLSTTGVLAVAIGPGGIFGILLGGIIGLALSQDQLDHASAPGVEHRAEEVLVAHVERGALHNPNLRRSEFDGMRTSAVVDDLEDRIRQVFEAHHGQLIDA
jgi:hypothetical protein